MQRVPCKGKEAAVPNQVRLLMSTGETVGRLVVVAYASWLDISKFTQFYIIC